MFEVLTILDWLSLALLSLLILAIMLVRRREEASIEALEPMLLGGVPFQPDAPLASYLVGDTNDALRVTVDHENRYLGPDQAAWALTALSESEGYATVGGYIPADVSLFLTDGELPYAIGSTDPAAAPASMLIDPDADLVDVNFDDPDVRYLQRTLLIVLALLALIPLVVRLFSPAV